MTRRPTTTNPTRGEIWYVQFDPQVDKEIGKLRPALVIGTNSVGRLRRAGHVVGRPPYRWTSKVKVLPSALTVT